MIFAKKQTNKKQECVKTLVHVIPVPKSCLSRNQVILGMTCSLKKAKDVLQ